MELRIVAAFAVAWVTTVALGPTTIRLLHAWRVGQWIRREECPPLAHLHAKKQDTPTMGGALILFAMTLAMFLCMDLHNPMTWLLWGGTLWFGAIGAYDDLLKLRRRNAAGLRGKKKLLLQSLWTVLFVAYLFTSHATPLATLYIPFCGCDPWVLETARDWSWLLFPWAILVVVGSSNAVNLTDGLDGLAAGCVALASSVLAVVAWCAHDPTLAAAWHLPYVEGAREIAIYLTAMTAASLGFLWHNGAPARLFMGDTGSLALGGVLGMSAFLLRVELLLVVVGGIFVAEAVSVMMQVYWYRFSGGKRVFRCAPLHHHFEYLGWPETRVVIRFWIVATLCALLGLFSLCEGRW